MEWRDIQAKSEGELEELLSEMRSKLVDVRFKAATGALKQVHEIEKNRKLIARILTRLHQLNSKSQAPNPKQIQNSNAKSQKNTF